MVKILILIAVAVAIVSSNAMAGQAQGQANKNKAMSYTQQDVTVLGDSETRRAAKAPNAAPITIVNSAVWPCGGYVGLGGQNINGGGILNFSKDSGNCIAWMLATQTTDLAKKEAYLCQMRVHRKAMKQNGTPCTKARRSPSHN